MAQLVPFEDLRQLVQAGFNSEVPESESHATSESEVEVEAEVEAEANAETQASQGANPTSSNTEATGTAESFQGVNGFQAEPSQGVPVMMAGLQEQVREHPVNEESDGGVGTGRVVTETNGGGSDDKVKDGKQESKHESV